MKSARRLRSRGLASIGPWLSHGRYVQAAALESCRSPARYPSRMLNARSDASPSPKPPTCSPGTTATGATCPGAPSPASAADPYRVWLSEIMLQQTTVAAVKPYLRALPRALPDRRGPGRGARRAVMQAWAGLGYYSRARNLHACAKAVVEKHGGRFPDTEAELAGAARHRRLHGGRHRGHRLQPAAAAVDGNVERVMSRLFVVEEPLPKAKPPDPRPRPRPWCRATGPAISPRP